MTEPELSDEQSLVLDIAMTGGNILVTGPGGTGKSFLLERIQDEMHCYNKRFMVCGATGVAAVNVGGTTVHSSFGVGLAQSPVPTLVNNIRNNAPLAKRLKKLDAVMIDEISMISAELFTKLDGVMRMLRDDARPFGGMQLILFGDFLQLPPVEGDYAFQCAAWKNAGIKVVTLTKIFRQQDKLFASSLNKLRLGRLDQEAKDFFNSRARARDTNPEIPPVEITAKNDKADFINRSRLDELPGNVTTYEAIDTGNPSGLKLLEKCIIPKTLDLKVGARVMCCHNLPLEGVMNGSCGRVVDLTFGPDVLFDNGIRLPMTHICREITCDGQVLASRVQIPLRLAWAVSSHKAQGSTLDKIRVHMADAFEHSQQYAALSRVSTAEGLFIASLNKHMLGVNPTALKFYEDAV